MRKSTEEKLFKIEWLYEVAKKAAAAKSKAMLCVRPNALPRSAATSPCTSLSAHTTCSSTGAVCLLHWSDVEGDGCNVTYAMGNYRDLARGKGARACEQSLETDKGKKTCKSE
jgi:hypothetical protein